ncbi:hypothetical protein ITG08_06600 [Vibrio cyclitrophicus]|uniref:hypothetical protein n=1 Tax=Vibrio cyclitrophicus TaxID=47951 RepID=UPI002060CAE3|nr:hypothetical protein [Vibrio cyclitrophicus]UPR26399.1 hypothetical protein ITG08_06600 [Vibrio cyclitrophicus]
MKLTYDVLWFEDQFDAIAPSVERLEGFIRDEGLIPVFEKRNGITEDEIYDIADKLDKNNPYDLVIFDFDMGDESLNGIDIAKILRTNIYTDMVFYSGKKPDEISELVYRNGIQGVYIAHKLNLIDDVEPLIQDQIKKISSLNGARGLLMSESSQIDMDLRNKAISFLSDLSDDGLSKVESDIRDRLIVKLAGREGEIKKLDLDKIISNTMIMDNDTLRKTCKDIFSGSTLFNEGGKYQVTQQERNFLAHNPHEVLENGDILVKGIRKERNYNHGEFSRVRKELIELKSLLNEIDV